MVFEINDKIVIPYLGTGVIEKITRVRKNDGSIEKLFSLRFTEARVKVTMLGSSLEVLHGWSLSIDGQLKSLLRSPVQRHEPSNWNHRKVRQIESFHEVAQIVLSLAGRKSDKGLTIEEERILRQAKKILCPQTN